MTTTNKDERNFNGYTQAERAAGRYHCDGCDESPRVGVPCACPTEEITATCPNCRHTGPEAQDFLWWENANGEGQHLLECGKCEHQFDPSEGKKTANEPDGTAYADDSTVTLLRAASCALTAEEDGSVFLPNWDGSDGEQEELIREAGRAVLAGDGIEGGMRTTKRALAALVHYVADMLEE